MGWCCRRRRYGHGSALTVLLVNLLEHELVREIAVNAELHRPFAGSE